MDTEELRREVSKIRWWHTIDLGGGIITPGAYNTSERLKALKMPENLQGKTVLDVGAWDGFYSFEAERRGAARVLATDSYSWGGGGWGTKAGFDLARRALDSNVEDRFIDVLDLHPDQIGVFDLVLCLGVLYHMRHPLLALEHVFSVTGEQLILETHADLLWRRRPAAAFYPGEELGEDATNWWGPNPAAVVGMLKGVGFREVTLVSGYSRARRLMRAIYRRSRKGAPFFQALQQSRMVFHAWR